MTVERRASLSAGQRASRRREADIPILPRPLCRGGEECGPSGEVGPPENRVTATIRRYGDYSHGWTLEISYGGVADLGDCVSSLEGAYKTCL